MKHDITLEGLQQWLIDEECTYASSTRECKRLVATLNGTLKVMVAGRVVWQGTQPFTAVEKYNAITEKHIPEKLIFKL